MTIPSTIGAYLSRFSTELGDRILRVYPALQVPGDPVSERFETLLRRPFASQRLAAMGIVKRWQRAKAAAVVAECGTGKTLMALSAIHVHSAGRQYAALVMAPPNIVGKWCREVLITIPGARVFLVDGIECSERRKRGPLPERPNRTRRASNNADRASAEQELGIGPGALEENLPRSFLLGRWPG
jgi:hypothetical protein